MRAILFISFAIVCSSTQAGQLFDPQGQAYWDNIQASATGETIEFTEILDIGAIHYNGATIAYVDIFGTGSSLTLYKSSSEKGDIPSPFHPNSWVFPVAPTSVEGGWTRFDFRDLKLLSKFDGGPTFQGGGGPLFESTTASSPQSRAANRIRCKQAMSGTPACRFPAYILQGQFPSFA